MARGEDDGSGFKDWRPATGTPVSRTQAYKADPQKAVYVPRPGVAANAFSDTGQGSDNFASYWRPNPNLKPEEEEGGGHGAYAPPSIISPTLPRPPRTKFGDPPKDVNTTITQEEIDEITKPAQGLESTVKTGPSTRPARPTRSIVRPGAEDKRTIVSV